MAITGQSFLYTVTDPAPTLSPISPNPVLGSSSAGSAQVTLNAGTTDANNALKYTATIAVNPLYGIQQKFGLTTQDLTTLLNKRGSQEKYFQSSNGSNSTGGGLYVLMPNNMLYAYVPDAANDLASTLAQPPVADFSPYANVYATTTLLYQATVSSVTNVNAPTITSPSNSGGTLNLSWQTGYAGTFMVTVYVSDGSIETQQSFLVKVS